MQHIVQKEKQKMKNCKPIHLNLDPGPEYDTKFRFWQGCPTILRTKGGRIYAAWYSGGVGEPDLENYNLLIRSDDDGWTWTEPIVTVASEPDQGFVAIDIQLWLDPLHRMWMFITQRYLKDNMQITDHDHLALWATVCNNPDAEILQWQEPRFISQGFLRTQPTVLSNGDWVLCAYDWSSPNYRYSRSKDQGKTWERCEGGKRAAILKKEDSQFDETMILERSDHSLLMFARDRSGLIAQSTCKNFGCAEWTPGEFTSLPGANSRFFLHRLKSGRVLLLHNNSQTLRTNLCAKLSEDDGMTWKYSLHLDSAITPEFGTVSYPDAVQSDDGRIFIIYDCGRNTTKEIRMAQITEEDIINGNLCDYSSYLSRIINKAPGHPYDQTLFDKKNADRIKWLDDVFFPMYGIHKNKN